MKTILIILISLFFTSCVFNEVESRENELKLKGLELDYLERLYSVKKGIEYNEKIRVLDSIILEAEIKLNK